MAVQLGTARFAGNGILSARNSVYDIRASFAGSGNLSARDSRINISASFAGSGSLSADQSVIDAQVSIVCTSSLQLIATNPLLEIISNQKSRLVIAVEIDTLAIS